MLTISVFNFKGGTGKSATTLNLGASLANSKRQILLIDTDGQRTLSFALGLDGTQPTALDWLNNPRDITPPPTSIKNLFLIRRIGHMPYGIDIYAVSHLFDSWLPTS